MASARTLVLAPFTAILLVPLAGLLSPIALEAQTTVFWDINGATAGSSGSTTAAGTWDQSTTANWSTNSAGTAATATWSTASGGSGIAVFSAGTNATGAYTVTASGTITGVAGITFQEGTVTVGGGTLTLANSGTINVASTTATISSYLTGSADLTKTGSGTLVLSSASRNDYTGATNINAGTLQLGISNYVIPNASAVTVASGATLDLHGFGETVGSIAGAGNITLGSGSLQQSGSASTTFSGVISGTGYLQKAGTGTLTLSGANTYTGATNINAGTLRLGANNALSSGTAVTVASGATLNLNNYSDTVGSLAGSGIITLGGGTLTVGNDNTNTTFSGSFTSGDTGTFAKTGTGTLTFGAGMNLASGTLILSGGTLNLGGFSSTFNSLSVTANSTIDFGATGASILNLNSLTVASGVTLTITDWNNAVDYFYSTNNPMPTLLGHIVFSGFTSSDTKWLSYDHEVSPVPEPSIYGAALLGLGTLFSAWGLRRRRTA